MANSEIGTSTDNSLGGAYQVFLSFRGPDTRQGFTNCLYHALVDAGIRVFLDDVELRPGEKIDGNLQLAIDDSKLYIPILSSRYVSSHWCLRELERMVKNTSKSKGEGKEKVILPIFYDVEPADVKLKTPTYHHVILNLEKQMEEDQKKKFNSEDVKMWRQALREVGGTKGWERKKSSGDGNLIEDVVNKVVDSLKTRQRKVTRDLVGMEDRIAAINRLLDIQSGGARLVGIYGMDGIGKSTLAKIIYNQLCPRFGKNCSFLDGIGEVVKTKSLVKLQEQLLSDMSISRVARNIDNIDHGIDTIRDTICNKKVLVVLDDVNEANQIEYLIGLNSFYPGTRILITASHKSVLKIRGLKYEIVPYEMEVLSDKDALQLFSRHAFNADFPPADFDTISKDIISTTGGLPSALQATGSLLFLHKEKKIWQEMLEKLKRTPNSDVLGKLRITYDALEMDQQQIFLDVACFFIGKDKTNPVFAWKECGFSPEFAIDVLTDRCTMKVLEDNKFWMHDQFRDLGRAIANQERSRLWAPDDIICELRSTEIKRSVQALGLTNWSRTDNQITVTAEQIKRFPHLRLLWLHNITCQGDFADCLSELKWISLSYPDGSSESHPRFEATNLHLENVVVGNLVGHGFTDDHIRNLIKEGRKLKVLTLENNMSIYRTPTFSEYSVLEKLTLSECSSLVEIDRSIGKLWCLTDLSIESCRNLGKLPEQIGELRSLQQLSLRNCDSLSELPESVSKLVSLMKLDVSHTPITALQDSICRLPSLSSLNASATPIAKVPGTMSELHRLQTLDLEHCHKIQELPELPRSLTTLRLRSSSLQTVPNLSNLTNLVELLLSDGSESKATSNVIQTCDLQWIGRLSKLRKQQLCLLNVRTPPTELGSLSLLKELTLYGLEFQSLKQLPPNLTVLELNRTRAKQVKLDGLPQLEKLTIRRCELVKRLYIPSSLRKLREAELSSCIELVEVQFLGTLISLEGLCIEDCKSLERLVSLSEEPGCNELRAPKLTNVGRRASLVSSSLKMLQAFQLSRCPELQEIHFASTFKTLGVFSVEECNSLKRISGLSNLKNLTRVGIVGCESLQVAEGMGELERLEQLKIHSCRSMERIIDASSSKIPKGCQIQLRDCGLLLDTGPDGSSITWESYKEKILNAPTQASDTEIETTFYDCETEIADPLLEQQDDGDEHEDDDEDEGKENDDDDNAREDDDDDVGREDGDDEEVGKEEDDYDGGREDDNDLNEDGKGDEYDDGYGDGNADDDADKNEDEEERDYEEAGEEQDDGDEHEDDDEDEGEENDDDDNAREDDDDDIGREDDDDEEVGKEEDDDEDGGREDDNDLNEEGKGDGYGDGYGDGNADDDADKNEDEEERDYEEAGEEQDDGDEHEDDDEDEGEENDDDDVGREYDDDEEVGKEDDDDEDGGREDDNDWNEEGKGDGYGDGYGDGNADDDADKNEDEEERGYEEAGEENDEGDDYNYNEYNDGMEDDGDKDDDEGDYQSGDDDGD